MCAMAQPTRSDQAASSVALLPDCAGRICIGLFTGEAGMRRLSELFINLKIRTSLVLTLSVFFFMLIAGAVLGVGSLHLNNQVMGDIVRNQQAHASVTRALQSYKDIQIALGRAMASYMVNSDMHNYAVAQAWGGSTTALSDDTRALLDEANEKYQATQALFNDYLELAMGVDDPDRYYERVSGTFSTMLVGGVEPLIRLLREGKVDEYQQFFDNTTLVLEQDVTDAVAALSAHQQSRIDTLHSNEVEHYRLVLILVSTAILAAFVICVLSYFFLNMIVLRPLRRAGDHFDAIANGDMTQRIDFSSRNEIGQLYAAMRRMQE